MCAIEWPARRRIDLLNNTDNTDNTDNTNNTNTDNDRDTTTCACEESQNPSRTGGHSCGLADHPLNLTLPQTPYHASLMRARQLGPAATATPAK